MDSPFFRNGYCILDQEEKSLQYLITNDKRLTTIFLTSYSGSFDMQIEKPKINLKVEKSDRARQTYLWLFIGLAFTLMVFPVLNSMNELMTQIALNLKGYRIIAQVIVPFEVRWVTAVLRLLGVDAYTTGEYVLIKELGKQGRLVEIIWNCVGWQSLIMFLVTAGVAFQKKFTLVSKVKALLFGLIGTYMINIIRISIVILFFRSFDFRIAIIFHDYGAILTNTGWLFLLWWFCFNFVLEEKAPIQG